MRWIVRLSVAGLLSSIMMASAFAAVTDNMYPTLYYSIQCSDNSLDSRDFCQTDNASLSVWFQASIGTSTETITRNSLNGSFNPTSLNVSYPSSPNYSGSSETDIIYQQSSDGFSGTSGGFTWCNDAVNAEQCDQHYVRYHYTSIDRQLACHETGHAVGLVHGTYSNPIVGRDDPILGCMTYLPNEDFLKDNNIDNINDTY